MAHPSFYLQNIKALSSLTLLILGVKCLLLAIRSSHSLENEPFALVSTAVNQYALSCLLEQTPISLLQTLPYHATTNSVSSLFATLMLAEDDDMI